MLNNYPKAYIDYLVYFHGQRDYFECHEVLEEEWKKAPRGKREPHWVGLIQIAVGLYHQRIGNFKGAERLFNNAISVIEHERKAIERLAFHYTELLKQLKIRHEAIKNKKPYTSFSLPITDKELIEACSTLCNDLDCKWGQPSDLSDETILYKHKLRDRTEVIEERQKNLKAKKFKKH